MNPGVPGAAICVAIWSKNCEKETCSRPVREALLKSNPKSGVELAKGKGSPVYVILNGEMRVDRILLGSVKLLWKLLGLAQKGTAVVWPFLYLGMQVRGTLGLNRSMYGIGSPVYVILRATSILLGCMKLLRKLLEIG